MCWLDRILPLALVVLLVAPAGLRGGAIDIPQQGARAGGQADAFSAQADDASAIFYNPAGLTQLDGTVITGGATVFLPDWKFHGANGAEQEMTLPAELPHIYAESDFGIPDWRFGIGVNNPFGLSEHWGGSGPERFIVNKAHVYTINIQPTVAYAVDEHLSLGLGLNVYYGDLELDRSAVLGPPPTPEGHFHFRGHGATVGATPAVLWKVDERNTLGLVYRSPFDIDFGGNATLKARGLKEIGPSHAIAGIDYPQSVTVAYAVRPVDPLKLEADVVWSDWNSVERIQLTSSNPAFNSTIRENWKSGFVYRVGAQYNLNRNWALRVGYAFGQNAIPSNTFGPIVPDSNYHLPAAGIGYSTENWSIDAAYEFIYRERRHISDSIYGPLVNGTWDNRFHTILISLTVKL